MHIVKNVRLKHSILFSLLVSIILSFFLSSKENVAIFLAIYLGIVVWLLATVHIVGYLCLNAESKRARPGFLKIFCLLFGKLLLLWGMFYMGWQFMGKELFIALINLPAQIFILVPNFRIRTG